MQIFIQPRRQAHAKHRKVENSFWRRKTANTCLMAVLAAAFCGMPAAAQTAPTPMQQATGVSPNNHMDGALSQEQFQKAGDYASFSKRLTKPDKAKGKTLEMLLAEDKAKAAELAKALPLSCDVTDAILAAEGPAAVDGQNRETHTYEVACANGMGYFLIAVDDGKPFGLSCLSADAVRKADIAAKREPGIVCRLGANAVLETLASAVMTHAGIACPVNGVRFIGTNSKTKIEYNEVSCTDGKGYILVTALPGQMMPPQTMACRDAMTRGFACKLTTPQ